MREGAQSYSSSFSLLGRSFGFVQWKNKSFLNLAGRWDGRACCLGERRLEKSWRGGGGVKGAP